MIRAAPEANEADLKLTLLGSSFRRMMERCLAVMLGQGQAVAAWSGMQGRGLKQDAAGGLTRDGGGGLKQDGEPTQMLCKEKSVRQTGNGFERRGAGKQVLPQSRNMI